LHGRGGAGGRSRFDMVCARAAGDGRWALASGVWLGTFCPMPQPRDPRGVAVSVCAGSRAVRLVNAELGALGGLDALGRVVRRCGAVEALLTEAVAYERAAAGVKSCAVNAGMFGRTTGKVGGQLRRAGRCRGLRGDCTRLPAKRRVAEPFHGGGLDALQLPVVCVLATWNWVKSATWGRLR